MDNDFIKAIIEGIAFTASQNADVPQQATSFVETPLWDFYQSRIRVVSGKIRHWGFKLNETGKLVILLCLKEKTKVKKCLLCKTKIS
ncbi:8598_t:CDS:2 [Cetraspora pellucida]|uniref:8598_t:CDS:1 n=1 Tax=Cetraspora pellucida TaxID=1433469 RepID=A0ACA9LVT7_9GLOM|nr:8598_t:CDS:2 [Cetraspora pellucida]